MAPLIANGRPVSVSRKKLVQPVLPALPKKFDVRAARAADSRLPSETVKYPATDRTPAEVVPQKELEDDVVIQPLAAAVSAVELISTDTHQSSESSKLTSSHLFS
jgi:hypothetical protein